MKTENYLKQQTQLPTEGKHIIANFDADTIVVYQAYNPSIANYAVHNQRFGGSSYSFSRMTWIKPNFMWMMYRSGWAQKPNQERILALTITLEGFIELLKKAVISSFKPEMYESREDWKNQLDNSEVRLQWDPDHEPNGEKMSRKAIQIGIKGETLSVFNDKWIKKIEDITDFVLEQKDNISTSYQNLDVPIERVLFLKDNKEVVQQIGLDK